MPHVARFAFDHYYSDGAFDAALPYVFANNPATLYDVGGNTGKWALRCCHYNANINVTLLDLPQQIALAKENIENAGFSHRIDFHAVDMLSDAPLPNGADVWWMSQFLGLFFARANCRHSDQSGKCDETRRKTLHYGIILGCTTF